MTIRTFTPAHPTARVNGFYPFYFVLTQSRAKACAEPVEASRLPSFCDQSANRNFSLHAVAEALA